MAISAREGITAKLDRARENIEEFDLRSGLFYRSNPPVIHGQDNTKSRRRTWRLAELPEIPRSLAGTAADAVANLRKPLDYLAFAIEKAACGQKPKHRVYFPIGRDATQYKALRRRYIQCAGKAAIDAFDAAEPYQGGKGHVLWQIATLNNPDKHEVPLALSGAYKGFDLGPMVRDAFRAADPSFGFDNIQVMIPLKNRRCPLQVGDVLLDEPSEPEMKEQRKFLFEIALHEPGVIECEPALKALEDFADAVRGVVRAFEAVLP
jgi:hypothetical protein